MYHMAWLALTLSLAKTLASVAFSAAALNDIGLFDKYNRGGRWQHMLSLAKKPMSKPRLTK